MLATHGDAASPADVLKAGGVDLIDLMKEGLPAPRRIVDLRQGRARSEKLGGEAKSEKMGAVARICLRFGRTSVGCRHTVDGDTAEVLLSAPRDSRRTRSAWKWPHGPRIFARSSLSYSTATADDWRPSERSPASMMANASAASLSEDSGGARPGTTSARK